jgi:uncharacterized protein (TIRG00374 family)
MQQDKQDCVPSSSSRLSRSGSIFRRPPLLLPFEEERNRDSHEHARPDIAKLLTVKMRGVANPQTPSGGLPLIPDTGIPNEGMSRRPNSGTSREGLHRITDTELPRSGIQASFMPQQISYYELDERLEDELDFSRMSTVHLMQLSGMLQAIPRPQASVNAPNSIPAETPTLSIYEDELLGKTRTLPRVTVPTVAATKPTPAWKVVLNHPAAKTALGLAIGVAIIFLLSHLIDFEATGRVLGDHLTTPEGMLHASIGGLAFAIAFTLRGARWKLFLNRISNVSVFKVIRIYWIGVFINFLLPIQGGEIAKSVMLKKVAGIPVSQSLPTVAMDKALDLMPVLGLIVIVPFIPGIHMNVTLWLILGFVSVVLVALMIIVALTALKRVVAIHLIQFFMKMLPKGIGAKIEGFGIGFVDSLIEGARRPKSFIPAALLTALAILCEGIYAWQESLAVGLNTIGLGIAIFGYTVFTMFSVLPTPPGQIGTNEGAKVIIFTTLLGFSKDKVLAMSILSHLIGPVIMTVIGMVSMWSLGLTFSGVRNIKGEYHEDKETKVSAQLRLGYNHIKR